MRVFACIAVGSLICAFIVACDATLEPTPTAAVTSPGSSTATSSDEEPAAETSISNTNTPEPESQPTRPPFPQPSLAVLATPVPPFSLSDYVNGDDVAVLMEGVGEERLYPAGLRDESEQLPLEDARELVYEFLNDSRVVVIKQGFRDQRVERIYDYCDNSTRILRYIDDSARGGLEGVFLMAGLVDWWSVQHTDLTAWNEPYVVGRDVRSSTAWIYRGYDALPGAILIRQARDGRLQMAADSAQHVRVFDLPDCEDPKPIIDIDASAWQLLGIGSRVDIGDDLHYDQPQIDQDEVVRRWDEHTRNLATFDILNGWPHLYFCDDHRGIVLSLVHPRLGETFTWSVKDASDILPNAIWLVYEYDNTNWGVEEEFLYQTAEEGLGIGVVGARLSECSIEAGLAYIDSISEDLDWWQQRPATPVPSR